MLKIDSNEREYCLPCADTNEVEGVIVDRAGTCVICLCEREGECDKCASSYELSDKDNRCGDCGNCSDCCTHEREGE